MITEQDLQTVFDQLERGWNSGDGEATVGAWLALGGLLVAVGGQLHPIGEGDTLPEAFAAMTGDHLWTISHVLLLTGLAAALVGLIAAYHARTFGPTLDVPLRIAIWGYSLGVLELVPHLLASRDHDELAAGELTTFVRVHLVLESLTTPVLAVSTVVLAVGVARTARTVPAWILATLCALGGTAFALAAPLVTLTEEPVLAALFAGELGVAVWLLGTGIRLAGRRPGGGRAG
jgi:hypothetical protein